MYIAYYILLSTWGFAFLVAMLAHSRARLSRSKNSQAYFWTGNLLLVTVYAVIALVCFSIMVFNQSFGGFLTDLANKFNAALSMVFELFPSAIEAELRARSMLVLPVVVWSLLFIFPLGRSTLGRKYSSLLGPLNATLSRRWVFSSMCILTAVILVIPLVVSAFKAYYPSFLYGSGILVLISLFFLSLSDQHIVDEELPNESTEPLEAETETVLDWPSILDSQGISIKRYGRLLKKGNSEVLNKTVAEVAVGDENQESTIFLASDHSGQLEYVEKVALNLLETSFEVVLLIAPLSRINKLVSGLKQLPRIHNRVDVVGGPDYDLHTGKCIYVVDPAMMSDFLLPSLVPGQNQENIGHGIRKIGAVVWWDLHYYAGIQATQVWAINHRLNRLLEAHGNPHILSVGFSMANQDAFTRGAAHDLRPYMESLMPVATHSKIIHVDSRLKNHVELYKLVNFDLNKLDHPIAAEGVRHIMLRALHASVLSNRRTYVYGWEKLILAQDFEQFLDSDLDRSTKISDWVELDINKAQASIFYIDASNVLDFGELIYRAGGLSECHYVGILSDGNPFIDYLIGQYVECQYMPLSRRLIAPKPRPATFKRQMNMVLSETEILMSEIVSDYRGESGQIKTILEVAANSQDGIGKGEVRYLENGKLKIENTYKNTAGAVFTLHKPVTALKPNKSDLTQLVATDRGNDLLLMVDTEKTWSNYYPGSMFWFNGEQFVTNSDNDEWEQSIEHEASISCKTAKTSTYTSKEYLSEFKIDSDKDHPTNIRFSGLNIQFSRCSGRYRETLKNVVTRPLPGYTVNSNTHKLGDLLAFIHDRENSRAIALQLNSLELGDTEPKILLNTMQVVFNNLLPVLFSLNASDFEISICESTTTLYFVESYSDNIGFADSLESQDFQLIIRTAVEWLASCGCDDGCDQCLLYSDVSRLAVNADFPVSKTKFLNIFSEQ